MQEMEKIHVGFMKDIRNWEFHRLYVLIINDMNRYQPKEGNIKTSFERIKPHVKKFKHALEKRGKSEYSLANKDLTAQRNQCLIMLRKRVQSYLPSYLPEESGAAKSINFLLNQFGKKYFVATINTQDVMVDIINEKINASTSFRNALTVLNLNGLIDKINKLTEEILRNTVLLNKESVVSKSRRDGVRKQAFKDLRVMVDAINSAFYNNQEYEEIDMELWNLVSNINGTLQRIQTPWKSRISKLRNKKATAEDELKNAQEEENNMDAMGDEGELEKRPATSLTEPPTTPLEDKLVVPPKGNLSAQSNTNLSVPLGQSAAETVSKKENTTLANDVRNLSNANDEQIQRAIVRSNPQEEVKSKFPINEPIADNIESNNMPESNMPENNPSIDNASSDV